VTRRQIVAASALAVASLAGCARLAPQPPPRLDLPSIEARFTQRLADRRTRAAVAEGDYSVWIHRPGAKDPPGVSVRVRLAAPNAFRFRVDAALGTAVDAAARRDTLVVDAPAFGLSAVTDAGADRSARQDIGGWVWRSLSAAWIPPPSAWAAGAAADSGWQLSWDDAGDSLALEVGSSGLPRSVRVRPRRGQPIELRYERWAAWDGVMWPARIVAADAAGRLRVTLQPQSLSLRPHRSTGLPALRRPSGALRLSRARLLAWLERLALESGADSTRGDGP